VVVTGDAGWLERLLLILLDNAIKFTPRGGQVHVELSGEQGVARLSVTDNGIGIPEDALARVFDPFFRGDPARSRATEGGGLGLALARWVAIQHRGTIDVASRFGQGSRFTLSLPTT
jgi:signal transduction histidine kinase